jgi:hypothetical protein
MTAHQLLVALPEFKTGLKALKPMADKAGRFRKAEMALEFDGRYATFVGPGVVFSVNALGEWPGRATFSAGLLLSLCQVPPTARDVTIRTDTRRIWVDTLSMPCTWQAAVIEDGAEFVGLPQPMDHAHMLQMLHAYSKDELYKQGFQKHIKRAKAWRYRCIVTALASLAPLGVTYDDLAHVVEMALKRGVKES